LRASIAGDAEELRVRFVSAVEFFDAEFKFEHAKTALSAVAELRSEEILGQRVPQPISMYPGEEVAGTDLFETLSTGLQKPSGPCVHVVVGRAGIGKSYLFRAIFARLYRSFGDAKAAQRLCPRPKPLLPEHRRTAYGLRTQLVVESFLNTEVAS
jgi:hypothetical protein